ncbi:MULTISPECIES: MATE family efflux transporter [unclassified Undibacterium]|uniref:MATE family efflux transporter n=1 Tax=unclassified Undibacterium TaxID=2630295 RepID=UPI002AC8FC25|nr:MULTISPECIES: MATE family efflux transporter [unclassified Undibacterium]MEB0138114.1 MATE family efflux transporter [Undibacterium sp. CCC2.1]MEB0171131.1 MATE family efflux transporter [Undibacterium sp. CCC1.1]MEB0175176.1 MATE family efflux transporter [Undibacterium sp. CCC3.4]MEB0214240.1 MATE family efflux transporter [Undibacterium sp. 5I2]WPX41820.1 MATE family efflux transporter [Undibacterium sp. CCC3.4]
MWSAILFRQYLRLAIPTVLAAWVYSAYAFIDGVFIGRYVGSTGLAAFNLIVPFLYIPYALSVMVGVGGATLVARLLGAGEARAAAAAFTQSCCLLCVLGLACSLALGLGAGWLVEMVVPPGPMRAYAESYLQIAAGFTLFATLSYALELFLRVEGAASYGLLCLCIGALLNIGLDYLFIVEFSYGMRGAAWATGISHAVAALLMLSYHVWRAAHLRLVSHAFEQVNVLAQIAYNGLSELLGELAPAFTILAFNWVIAGQLGQAGLVAYAVLEYLTIAAVVTMVALVQSMQTLVSFQRGAGEWQALRSAMHIGALCVLLFAAGAMLLMWTQSDQLIVWLLPGEHAEAWDILGTAVPWYALAFIPAGANLLISGYFTAIEAPLRSTVIALLRSFVLLLAALCLLVAWMGASGIWFALLLAEILTLVLSAWLYRRHLLENNFV